PAGAVVEGFLEDAADHTSVVLRMRGGDLISADIPSVAAGRALLTAAGVSAEQQVLRMRLANATTQIMFGGCLPAASSVVLTVAGIFAAIIAFSTFTAAPFAFLAGDLILFFLLIRALTPPQVVIGADGLTVERMLTRRFIPFADISEATLAPGSVVLVV